MLMGWASHPQLVLAQNDETPCPKADSAATSDSGRFSSSLIFMLRQESLARADHQSPQPPRTR
jgi:hypothetical protein